MLNMLNVQNPDHYNQCFLPNCFEEGFQLTTTSGNSEPKSDQYINQSINQTINQSIYLSYSFQTTFMSRCIANDKSSRSNEQFHHYKNSDSNAYIKTNKKYIYYSNCLFKLCEYQQKLIRFP